MKFSFTSPGLIYKIKIPLDCPIIHKLLFFTHQFKRNKNLKEIKIKRYTCNFLIYKSLFNKKNNQCKFNNQ